MSANRAQERGGRRTDLTALAILAAVLVVPGIHGSFDHDAAAGSPGGGSLVAADASGRPLDSTSFCSLCLASRHARTLAHCGHPGTAEAGASARECALPAAPVPPKPLGLAVAGPRAPPLPS